MLIVRSRPLRPTSAGAVAAQAHKQLRLLRADLERDLQELAPSAPAAGREDERISIAINADSIATWALDAVHDLVRQRLPLEIIADDQDFTQEWLRSGQVLGCVTTLKQAMRGCRMVPLGAMHYVAVASSALRAKTPANGLTAHNFREVPFLSFNRKGTTWAAEFVARTFGLKRVALNHLFVPSTEGPVACGQGGLGVGVLPSCWCARNLPMGCGGRFPVTRCPFSCTGTAGTWNPRCWKPTQALIRGLGARPPIRGNSGR